MERARYLQVCKRQYTLPAVKSLPLLRQITDRLQGSNHADSRDIHSRVLIKPRMIFMSMYSSGINAAHCCHHRRSVLPSARWYHRASSSRCCRHSLRPSVCCSIQLPDIHVCLLLLLLQSAQLFPVAHWKPRLHAPPSYHLHPLGCDLHLTYDSGYTALNWLNK